MAFSTARRTDRIYSFDSEQKVSDTEINDNRELLYHQSGQLTSGKTIRMIRLLPLSNGEELCCEIVKRDLDKALGDYEAISYTWGDLKEQAVMRLDGRPMRVSRKVSDVLRTLRHAWRPRISWLDSLCINQADTKEKSHRSPR
ncbi:hypothetical protein RRF57_002820 [Xylaria bambusicola]|uniref:Heterokaryon incompatibility domain-containing protein n=1 Tax=Xylaria bambusicola TaxID=326684 RepID=A0AAN7U6W3_9PEZI